MFNNRPIVTRSIAIRDCRTKTFEAWICHATSNFATLIKKIKKFATLIKKMTRFDEDEKNLLIF